MRTDISPAMLLMELLAVPVFNNLSQFQQQEVLRMNRDYENEVLTIRDVDWLERLHRVYIGF